jgi:hypothetical protein
MLKVFSGVAKITMNIYKKKIIGSISHTLNGAPQTFLQPLKTVLCVGRKEGSLYGYRTLFHNPCGI